MSVYVLLFHSVDDRPLSSLKGLGNIHPIAFERMMRGLKRDFDVVDLRDLVGRLSSGEAGRERLLAVTFDDGPKSYAANAVPLFETLVIPSTCFIISDCIGDRQVYWRYLFNFCLNEGHEEALGRLLETHYGEAVPKGGVRT
jgi:peptidoglycan/xylan/chitin deacetylase (PgdA/CDA1 family)